jgi:hypothetical protein
MRIVNSDSPDFYTLWNNFFQEKEVLYPLYQHKNIEYYKAYAQTSCFDDKSFVVEENGLALIGVRMAINFKADGSSEISGFGLPIFFIEDPNIDPAWGRTAHKHVRIAFDHLIEEYPNSSIFFRDFLVNGKLSFLSHYLLENGGETAPEFTRIIDLTESKVDLHRQVTKSNRNQIKWGEKNLAIQVLDSATICRDDMIQFQTLHIHAAGRQTRSQETWEKQYEMVCAEEAFVVFGKLEDELVTAALFSYSPDYSYYGVSASKRELFDKPLSHAILWRGILHSQLLGCRSFEMGNVLYPNQGDILPSKKELGISTFKRGFGGKTYVRMNVTRSPNHSLS